MEHTYFKKLSKILWITLVAGVVVLAVYVSLGRFLMSTVGAYKDEILQQLNTRLPFRIEAEHLNGEWHSFTPELVLRGLRLTFPDGTETPVELVEGRLALDTLESLRTRRLHGHRLELRGLSLQGEIDDGGRFRITGFASGGGNFADWLEDFLGNVEQVVLLENYLDISLPGGERRSLDLNLQLNREGIHRRLSARLVSTTGTVISARADGVGNPFDSRTYSGDLYLEVDMPSLTALRDLVPAAASSQVQVDGAVSLAAWVAWKFGEPSVEATVKAGQLTINLIEEGRTIPVDSLAFQATLQQQRNRWTVFASDLSLTKGGETLELPRLQMDSWGDSLRLRATEVQLAQVNAFIAGLAAVPPKLADVLQTLQPKGWLRRLQFSLDDYRDLSGGWTLEANFDELAVQSWKGAPGVKSGQGYLTVEPGSGEVIVDSQQFSLDFPALYADPLFYDDLFGTINIDWDQDGLSLSSGLVTASGVEGTASALFGLSVPFSKTPVGIEMELMVGLTDTHPIHRTKYLPYTLNEALLGWLRRSLGEGKVETGAFLWRGALRKTLPEHRTVQLFFDVSDTRLNYHPSWPEVSNLAGLVLIDDTNVSVWSERAQLYETELDYLSAEAWLGRDKKMQLAIAGSMRGEASDGLKVINNSPLTTIVGKVFSNWQMAGDLTTALELQMNLGDSSEAPVVAVDARLRDVDLLIRPGELPITALNGELNYSSARGLSADTLSGQLWDQPLTAQLVQGGVEELAADIFYDPKASPVLVRLQGPVDVAAIRDWQQLPQLAFAEGRTDVSALVTVLPGKPPLLTGSTELVGVALDLPEPFAKVAEDSLPLTFSMPLDASNMVLSFDVDNALQLALDVSGGGFKGASLAFGAESARVKAGTLLVGGHAGLIDELQWKAFADTYFTATSSGADSDDALPALTIAFEVDALQADRFRIWGQEFTDVLLSLRQREAEGDWWLAAQNSWFEGELTLDKDMKVGDLKIAHVDLAGLDSLAFSDTERAGGPLELPDLAVSVAALRNDELLLGELDFQLATDGDMLTAQDITADFGGLVLTAERPGSFSWQQGDPASSQFKGLFVFKDLGDVFAKLNYQRVLQSSRGSVKLDLQWPGGPQNFALASSQGELLLKARDGRFLEAPEGASGTLRVVSLLNFAGVIRRLSLTHMFESGIPFDSVDAEAHFHSGTLEVNAIDVKGASSGFRFTGLVDLDNAPEPQTVDGELVVTLPVANNLPWVAALAAGLPVAAGVFVVSKVFEKQVNRFSSGVYSITGNLEDPEVAFDRVFDDTDGVGLNIMPEDPNAPPTADKVTEPSAQE